MIRLVRVYPAFANGPVQHITRMRALAPVRSSSVTPQSASVRFGLSHRPTTSTPAGRNPLGISKPCARTIARLVGDERSRFSVGIRFADILCFQVRRNVCYRVWISSTESDAVNRANRTFYESGCKSHQHKLPGRASCPLAGVRVGARAT
jgi:hypothetical protein